MQMLLGRMACPREDRVKSMAGGSMILENWEAMHIRNMSLI